MGDREEEEETTAAAQHPSGDGAAAATRHRPVAAVLPLRESIIIQPIPMESHLESASPQVKREFSHSPESTIISPEKSLDGNAKLEESHDRSLETLESTSNPLVLYNPPASDANLDMSPASSDIKSRTPPFQKLLSPATPSRISPTIGAFTIQCATCFKWRLIPTKEKYEKIRENILQEPFVCEQAREWHPDISCDNPADISPDGSRLWAIDKPNIARPPPGWERLLRLRSEGSSKFADVYYVAPSGKRFRSMVEIEKYLLENPAYISEGVKMCQFSFQTPRPLQENYLRKRPTRMRNLDTIDAERSTSLVPIEANPLSWATPPNHSDLTIDSHLNPPFEPSLPPSKKKKNKKKSSEMPSSKQTCSTQEYDKPNTKLEDTQQ